MAQINRSKLILCPHCGMTVLPERDGTCPSCQEEIAESATPVEQSDVEIDELEIEEALQPEEELYELEEDAEEEELAETETWLASEPEYAAYLAAAERITRRFWGFVIPNIVLGMTALGFFVYSGFKNIFLGETIAAIIGFAIALGMAFVLVAFGITQGNKNADNEVARVMLELPGFDVFYELYRPHLRDRFWQDKINSTSNDIFQAITKHKS